MFLVTADFVNSDYCWGIEMQRALDMHASGDARVIPIILKYCDWESAPFAKLQALPRERPVEAIRPRGKAFSEIAKEIREIVEKNQFSFSIGARLSITP
jgi:hypothetical protein